MVAVGARAAWILVPALLVGCHALRTGTRVDEITGEPAAALAWRPALAAVLQESHVIGPTGPITSWGKALNTEAQSNLKGPGGRLAAELPVPEIAQVCERARGVVFAEHSDLHSGGSVYSECAHDVALGGSREDAVNVLDDCMALVDELVRRLKDHLSSATNAPEGALCRNVVDGLKAGWIVSKPTAADGEAVQVVGAGQKDALQKAAEAMTDVCVDSVEKAEAGVRSEDDAMKLRNAVAPLCEESARKRLGDAQSDSASVNGTLREWCYQLDGRLALALETGFLFALHPEDAYKQAGTTNPYATATRRQFCDRFGASVVKQAASRRSETKPVQQQPAPAVAAAPAAPAVVASQQTSAAEPAPAAQPAAVAAVAAVVSSPAATPQPAAQPAAPQPVVLALAPQPAAAAQPAASPQPTAGAKQGGVDMLLLLKALSVKPEWAGTCSALVSSLASKEGSVIDDQVLLDKASKMESGQDVMTFNAADQAEVSRCANRMKVLAVQSGVLAAHAAAKPGAALLEVSETGAGSAALLAADQLGALIDSPWARDACTDIAHGYLMARLADRRLARPAEQAPKFCQMYAQDLQSLQDDAAVASRLRAQKEVEHLRKGKLAASMKQHKAAMAQAAPSVPEQKPAGQKMALASESESVEAQAPQAQDDADDGSSFW